MRTALTILLGLSCACAVDTAPSGLRATPPGNGPRVVFDVLHRPLPRIPFPNDVATSSDPQSRTGRRVNVSMVAPTTLETSLREGFDAMEGWGTLAPVTVEFERGPDFDPARPAIDLEDLRHRMQNDGYDLRDDPVYVVNLTTGVPVLLDAGNGNFPLTARDAGDDNLLFETHEEGRGLTQADYRPELDRDFDGVLDHPNSLTPGGSLLTWYERETDTLIVRPVVPLEEKTRYAVVLTDRLRGQNHEPVRSPFPYVHHPSQTQDIARLREVLGQGSLQNYYGELAGTGLDHVAFAWSFTTQPVHEDLRILRDGLYGKGPFSRFSRQFPPAVTLFPAAGKDGPACAARQRTPFTVMNDESFGKVVEVFLTGALGLSKGEAAAVTDSSGFMDHAVIGSFESPWLLGDPAKPSADTRFHLNFRTGDGDVGSDRVHFWLVVPKKGERSFAQPFPVALWGHRVGSDSPEILLHAGELARHGVAVMGIDLPGHGVPFGAAQITLARALLSGPCLAPWVDGIAAGRARDVNGDGTADSGGLFFSANMFHTRDEIRQGALDMMQATRILRSFDGVRLAEQDYDGDGRPNLAGDFDGDGIPDVGGVSPIYSAGISLGGILSGIHGGIDPQVAAAAPVSGGGGLTDVAYRGGLADVVMSQQLTPRVMSVPAGERAGATKCAGDQKSVRMVVNDLLATRELEIACLAVADVPLGTTVVLANATNGQRRCARADAMGHFSLPVPASKGDRLDLSLYPKANAVDSYATCNVSPDAPDGRKISTWELGRTQEGAVADPEKDTCARAAEDLGLPATTECQQVGNTFFPVGSRLIAAEDGLGLSRQTPALRRMRDLAQAALDPADPANFAPYYMLRPLLDENGTAVPPRALLALATAGDGVVPTAASYAFARAAGAIPFLPPRVAASVPAFADYATPPWLYELQGNRTPNEVLIDSGSVEAVARSGLTHGGPACGVNYRASELCTSPPERDEQACQNALFDVDWLSEGAMNFDQPHPAVPLRLARLTDVRAVDAQSLLRGFAPRERGVPFTPDDSAFKPEGRLLASASVYVAPAGASGWSAPDVCRAFDAATYGDRLIGVFFRSGGTDIQYLTHPATHRCLAESSASGACRFAP